MPTDGRGCAGASRGLCGRHAPGHALEDAAVLDGALRQRLLKLQGQLLCHGVLHIMEA